MCEHFWAYKTLLSSFNETVCIGCVQSRFKVCLEFYRQTKTKKAALTTRCLRTSSFRTISLCTYTSQKVDLMALCYETSFYVKRCVAAPRFCLQSPFWPPRLCDPTPLKMFYRFFFLERDVYTNKYAIVDEKGKYSAKKNRKNTSNACK